MSINTISEKITCFIKNNEKNMTEEKEEIVKYGAEILIYEIILLAIMFSIALVLGIFKYALAYFLSYGTLRSFTGGAHARTRVICSVSYLALMYSIIFISKYLWAGSFYPSIAILLLELFIMYKYVPGDTEEKPIISKRMIKRLRISSFITVILIFTCAIILWHYDRIFYNVIILSTIYVVFLLSPIGYILLKCKHSHDG